TGRRLANSYERRPRRIDMNKRFTAICAFLLFASPAFARSQNSQEKTSTSNTDKAQIVGTAEITKVDAKKQVLQVKNLEAGSNANTVGNGGGAYPGGRTRGGGAGYPGGGRRRTGGGYPYPGGGGSGGGGGYPGRRPPGGGTPSA